MTIKRYAIAMLIVMIAAVLWRYRNHEAIQAILNPKQTQPIKIEFDNGTVRKYATPSAASTKGEKLPAPTGIMRKCVRGAEILYTNNLCPLGAKELKLEKGVVNVIDSGFQATKKPLNQGQGSAVADNGNPEQTIRQKAIERAINQ